MKNNLKILIPVLILGALAYQFRAQFLPVFNNLQNNFSATFLKPAPCTEPIPYTLGTFNTKFNISEKYFLEAVAEAEAIWEKPYEKELFTYAPENTSQDVLKINLIYDYRQEATSKLASLGIVVKDNRASYDMLKAKFTALKAEYEKEKIAWNARVSAFNQKEAAYEAEVKYWNARGGASQEKFDELEALRSELQSESKQLQILQNNLNDKADEINAMVVVLNRLVSTLNLSVDKYNTINEARGESFEEGVYTSDGVNSEIDIYEFSSRSKLVRVLAHEFGHALDLEHVEDPKAIMYRLNQGNTMALSEADLEALEAKCAQE